MASEPEPIKPTSFPNGTVRVSDQALQTIVQHAISEVPGAIPLNNPAEALTITPTVGGIAVNVQFAVQYGTSIGKLVDKVAKNVRFRIELSTGIAVMDISLQIAGTRRIRSASVTGVHDEGKKH